MIYLVVSLILYAVLANIIWPSIVQKNKFEGRVLSYMKANNITSPYCYTKYNAKIGKSLFDLYIDVGIDDDGYFLDCNTLPTKYYRCTPHDFTNVLHPCSFVKSFFRIFAL